MESKALFKKATFQSDKEINDFNFCLISLLRWDLPQELKEQHIANSIAGLELFHSQYLLYCVSSQDIFDVLLGDRLSVDPDYLGRMLKVQNNVELYARYQSIATNRKAKSKYVRMLSELLCNFDNPENDDKLIDFKKVLEKWVNS